MSRIFFVHNNNLSLFLKLLDAASGTRITRKVRGLMLHGFLWFNHTFVSFYRREMLLDKRFRHMHIDEHFHQVIEKLSVQLGVFHLVYQKLHSNRSRVVFHKLKIILVCEQNRWWFFGRIALAVFCHKKADISYFFVDQSYEEVFNLLRCKSKCCVQRIAVNKIQNRSQSDKNLAD